VPEIKQLINK